MDCWRGPAELAHTYNNEQGIASFIFSSLSICPLASRGRPEDVGN